MKKDGTAKSAVHYLFGQIMRRLVKPLLASLIATSAVAAVAGDIVARVTFPNNHTEVLTVTTNTATLPGLHWDAADGGGHYEMTFQLTNGTVVVAHHEWGSYKGVGSEVIHWTRIPTNKIPHTFTVLQHTVSVTRAESKASSK